MNKTVSLAALFGSVLIVLGVVILIPHVDAYQKADELEDYFRDHYDFTIVRCINEPDGNITNFSYSYYLWILFVDNKPGTVIVRKGCAFYYYHFVNETWCSWHKFDVYEFTQGQILGCN